MKHIWSSLQRLKPALLMVVVQIAFAAVNVLYKFAINDGMSMRVATAYRLIFASACTVPLALILERKRRPKLTWRLLFLAFLCGLFGGTLFQNLFFEAFALTSATFVSAFYNLIPAVTFILAIFCGFEKLNWRTAAGKAKVLGTVIGIGGAMLLTFFKGVEIDIWSSFHINLLHHHTQNGHDSSKKMLGVLCALGSCFSFALWLIVQAKMSVECPSHHSSAALMSLMGAVQATVFALCIDRDWSQWRLGWDVRLLSVAYAGIVASGMMVVVISWCVQMRGPLFASIFNPLMLVLVALAASLMLNENLHLGSVLGAVLIICGLYMVLWGKSKETKKGTHVAPTDISQESETVEVVVDQKKCDHYSQSQTNSSCNIAFNDCEDSTRDQHEVQDVHNKEKGEEMVSGNIVSQT